MSIFDHNNPKERDHQKFKEAVSWTSNAESYSATAISFKTVLIILCIFTAIVIASLPNSDPVKSHPFWIIRDLNSDVFKDKNAVLPTLSDKKIILTELIEKNKRKFEDHKKIIGPSEEKYSNFNLFLYDLESMNKSSEVDGLISNRLDETILLSAGHEFLNESDVLLVINDTARAIYVNGDIKFAWKEGIDFKVYFGIKEEGIFIPISIYSEELSHVVDISNLIDGYQDKNTDFKMGYKTIPVFNPPGERVASRVFSAYGIEYPELSDNNEGIEEYYKDDLSLITVEDTNSIWRPNLTVYDLEKMEGRDKYLIDEFSTKYTRIIIWSGEFEKNNEITISSTNSARALYVNGVMRFAWKEGRFANVFVGRKESINKYPISEFSLNKRHMLNIENLRYVVKDMMRDRKPTDYWTNYRSNYLD